MVWPTLGSRKAKEQNRTVRNVSCVGPLNYPRDAKDGKKTVKDAEDTMVPEFSVFTVPYAVAVQE